MTQLEVKTPLPTGTASSLKTSTSTGVGGPLVGSHGGAAPTCEVHISRRHSLTEARTLLADSERALADAYARESDLADRLKKSTGVQAKELNRQVRATQAFINDAETVRDMQRAKAAVSKAAIASKTPQVSCKTSPSSSSSSSFYIPISSTANVPPPRVGPQANGVSVVINNVPPPIEKKEVVPFDPDAAFVKIVEERRKIAASRMRGAAYAQAQRGAAGQAIPCDSSLVSAVTPRSVRGLQLRSLMSPHDLPEFPDTSPYPGIGVFLHTDVCGPYSFKTTIANNIAFQLLADRKSVV